MSVEYAEIMHITHGVDNFLLEANNLEAQKLDAIPLKQITWSPYLLVNRLIQFSSLAMSSDKARF
jgi:hypothetical protein